MILRLEYDIVLYDTLRKPYFYEKCGPLDIFSVAVGTNDLASSALRVGP